MNTAIKSVVIYRNNASRIKTKQVEYKDKIYVLKPEWRDHAEHVLFLLEKGEDVSRYVM